MNLGEKLKEFRERRGFTYEKLATRIGVDVAYAWKVENEVIACKWPVIQKFARALNLSAEETDELRALYANKVTGSKLSADLLENIGKKEAGVLRPILRVLLGWPSARVKDLGALLANEDGSKFLQDAVRLTAKSRQRK